MYVYRTVPTEYDASVEKRMISVTPSVVVDLPSSVTSGHVDRFSYPYPSRGVAAAGMTEAEVAEAKVIVTALAVRESRGRSVAPRPT